MGHFRYKALTSAGEVREGVQEADSQSIVFRSLRQQGWWPVSAVEVKPGAAKQSFLPKFGPRIAAKDMAAFFHELAILLSSGIALDRALDLLTKRSFLRGLSQPCGRLLINVRDGSSLAQALAAEPVFPKISVGMVRAGETSGHLDGELLRLAELMTRAAAIRAEIISALVYPIILLITAGLAIGVIMLFVIPEFIPLFDDSGQTPPLAFRLLMGIQAALVNWGWLLIPGIIASSALARWAGRQPNIRLNWDTMKLRIPIFGELTREIETGRFCRTLGTLVKADVALPSAIALAADSVANTATSSALNGVAKGLREGGRLVDRLIETRQFSSDVYGLLRVGEESGRLGEMLLRQADLSEDRIRTQVARLLAMMIPGITVCLGAIVAGIVSSLLMAIISINDLAQ